MSRRFQENKSRLFVCLFSLSFLTFFYFYFYSEMFRLRVLKKKNKSRLCVCVLFCQKSCPGFFYHVFLAFSKTYYMSRFVKNVTFFFVVVVVTISDIFVLYSSEVTLTS